MNDELETICEEAVLTQLQRLTFPTLADSDLAKSQKVLNRVTDNATDYATRRRSNTCTELDHCFNPSGANALRGTPSRRRASYSENTGFVYVYSLLEI
jgi:hypothetical protein